MEWKQRRQQQLHGTFCSSSFFFGLNFRQIEEWSRSKCDALLAVFCFYWRDDPGWLVQPCGSLRRHESRRLLVEPSTSPSLPSKRVELCSRSDVSAFTLSPEFPSQPGTGFMWLLHSWPLSHQEQLPGFVAFLQRSSLLHFPLHLVLVLAPPAGAATV